jgi:squalene-hopene/tetraprenyl-beta-curcumene cyclase
MVERVEYYHGMRKFGMTVSVLSVVSLAAMVARASAPDPSTASWNAKGAAAYLDARMEWWSTWPKAARDHDTFCVSCHSAAPYAMARPVLRGHLGEAVLSPQEQRLIANVSKRVLLWNEVAPYYPDQTRGVPKSSESRGTEAVLNALVLSARDAQAAAGTGAGAGVLRDDTRTAFANMWALQMKTGDLNGAWVWLNFHLEPWESPTSPYVGATLAAMAVGMAPGGYASSAEAKEGLAALRDFLQRGFATQNVFNKVMLMAASGTLDGLITPEQRQAMLDETRALQQPDGGWSVSAFGAWTRVDKSAPETQSDALATALATLAFQRAGVPGTDPSLTRGLDWLRHHQDPTTGGWPAASLNKQRDPASDAARFTSDAASAYAVLSLTFKSPGALTKAPVEKSAGR